MYKTQFNQNRDFENGKNEKIEYDRMFNSLEEKIERYEFELGEVHFDKSFSGNDIWGMGSIKNYEDYFRRMTFNDKKYFLSQILERIYVEWIEEKKHHQLKFKYIFPFEFLPHTKIVPHH